jgi:hypothetical protein
VSHASDMQQDRLQTLQKCPGVALVSVDRLL